MAPHCPSGGERHVDHSAEVLGRLAVGGHPALAVVLHEDLRSVARYDVKPTPRMLGNGLCTHPVELDCRMESACETCSCFQTSIEFKPTLLRQRDHAREHGQDERAALFERLLERVGADDA